MRKEIKIEGLENVHAINESGEGTVFRGRRVREIETVVKVLPYPVHIRRKDDPATIVYLREIKRLRHLNQVFNIHLVKILNTGVNEKDLFPFIESEFIKGPDLEELMSFPNRAVFRTAEVIDLATQMADALAHCHSALVKHGRINSNNIRLNTETGFYTLLNFGRTLLTDEQRKNEVTNTRAPEYLAPEQYEGEILFETDIYSLGVILFQVLTGTLPGPPTAGVARTLAAATEPAISVGQQIKEQRRENLPLSWSDAEKAEEMNIPVWLLNIVAICLQEEPSKRYSNGIKLQEAIKSHSGPGKDIIPAPVVAAGAKPAEHPVPVRNIAPAAIPEAGAKQAEHPAQVREIAPAPVQAASTKNPEQTTPPKELSSTAAVVPGGKQAENKPVTAPEDKAKEPDDKEAEIKRLKALLIQKEGQLDVYKYQTADYNPDSNKLNISRPVFFVLLAAIALLGALAVYSYFFRKPETRGTITTYTDSDTTAYNGNDTSGMVSSEMYADSPYSIDTAALVRSLPPIPEEEKKTDDETDKTEVKKTEPKPEVKKPAARTAKKTAPKSTPTTTNRQERLKPEPDQNPEYFEPREPRQVSNKYTLAVAKAYFYDKPDIRSRRPVYLSNINESELTASEDTNGFIYVVFFNTDRQITKGWLRKSDLRRIN